MAGKQLSESIGRSRGVKGQVITLRKALDSEGSRYKKDSRKMSRCKTGMWRSRKPKMAKIAKRRAGRR
jgi:hypothetical protein